MDKLQNFDQYGNPPVTRVADAQSAYQIWNTIRVADGPSSLERAKHDAAYDNARPLDQAKLDASGQSYRLNVSWGFMDMLLDTSMAGYVDIYSSIDTLFECPTRYGNEVERSELSMTVSKEITDGIRSWPDFYWNYLRLCSTFIKHGVSIALMNDESDWRWHATNLSDFKIPRNTMIGQENIGIAGCVRFYSVSDLYGMIRDEKLASKLGYNVDNIRKTIYETIKGCGDFNAYHNMEWEHLQIALRNNDAFFANGSANAEGCRIVHLFVKEMDGKITHLMINDSRDNPSFLYQKIGRFENVYQAFIMFCYGVGTNDYYHGIRGQGYKVFPTNGALNIASNQMLENATYGSAVTLQPDDENAVSEMQFMPAGPFNLITPGIKALPNTVLPNVSQNSIPVLNMFSQMLRDRTTQYDTSSLISAGSVEKTRAQVLSENAAGNRLSTASINLFYVPFELLVKEMVRRITRKGYNESHPGGVYVARIVNRLKQLGQDGFGDPDRYLNAFYALDIERLKVTRAIGNGSENSRMAIFDRLFQMYSQLPDTGKEALVWDVTCATAGSNNAGRYATRPGRNNLPMVDVTIAGLENNILMMNGQIEIVDGQNHFVHAKTHIEFETPMIQQAQEAMEVDDIEAMSKLLPGLNAVNEHTSQHVQKVSADPLLKAESAQLRQILQQADEILHNGLAKLAKAQQKAQQDKMIAGPQGQQQEPQMDPMTMAKIEGMIRERQARLSFADEEHKQKLALRAQESAAKIAIEDAKARAAILRGGR